MTVKEPEIMTIYEVAEYIRAHPVTIRRLLKRGQFPGFKVTVDWRFFRSDVDKWMRDEAARQLLKSRNKDFKLKS